jgi:acyl carrier protein
MSSEIEERVMALVASTLSVDQAMVARDAAFAGDLAADSLGFVTLILAVEDEFQVDIPDEDAAGILTVEQMIEYVSVELALKEPSPKRVSNVGGTAGLR